MTMTNPRDEYNRLMKMLEILNTASDKIKIKTEFSDH